MITEPLPAPLIPLHSPEVAFEAVGGKGANLIALSQGGFPVPDAFLIPTETYRNFVAENQLEGHISAILEKTDPTNPDELEQASSEIRVAFTNGHMLPIQLESLETAWHWLGSGPVAVRSSATAEDLPDMSFAGQQD
ncbi:MAG: PEP/pyruvate-binding domain-containing protein, partial [Anaerolineales bacterium]